MDPLSWWSGVAWTSSLSEGRSAMSWVRILAGSTAHRLLSSGTPTSWPWAPHLGAASFASWDVWP